MRQGIGPSAGFERLWPVNGQLHRCLRLGQFGLPVGELLRGSGSRARRFRPEGSLAVGVPGTFEYGVCPLGFPSLQAGVVGRAELGQQPVQGCFINGYVMGRQNQRVGVGAVSQQGGPQARFAVEIEGLTDRVDHGGRGIRRGHVRDRDAHHSTLRVQWLRPGQTIRALREQRAQHFVPDNEIVQRCVQGHGVEAARHPQAEDTGYRGRFLTESVDEPHSTLRNGR